MATRGRFPVRRAISRVIHFIPVTIATTRPKCAKNTPMKTSSTLKIAPNATPPGRRMKQRNLKKTMIRFVVTALAVFLVALLLVGSATAQEATPPAGDTLAIQRLRVQVMPEFDDPRVLVIVQGRLEATTLPRTLTLRVP